MGFSNESRERSRPALPMAAMVDMLFLLLVFFMVTSIYGEAEMQIAVSLPGAETGEPAPQVAMPIIVTIDAQNQIFLSEQQRSLEELLPLFQQLARQFPGEGLVVRGDRQAHYGLAVEVMDLAQQAGITEVSVATVQPPESP